MNYLLWLWKDRLFRTPRKTMAAWTQPGSDLEPDNEPGIEEESEEETLVVMATIKETRSQGHGTMSAGGSDADTSVSHGETTSGRRRVVTLDPQDVNMHAAGV